MTYDYRNYNFLIHQNGRNPFGFNELSDGYSSVIQIVTGLIMRMEQNWLLKGTLSEYDVEGIALIDEPETHLHIELQRKILPFLVTFFPRVQFIVSIHSPYVLTSISEATIFDLEKIQKKRVKRFSLWLRKKRKLPADAIRQRSSMRWKKFFTVNVTYANQKNAERNWALETARRWRWLDIRLQQHTKNQFLLNVMPVTFCLMNKLRI